MRSDPHIFFRSPDKYENCCFETAPSNPLPVAARGFIFHEDPNHFPKITLSLADLRDRNRDLEHKTGLFSTSSALFSDPGIQLKVIGDLLKYSSS